MMKKLRTPLMLAIRFRAQANANTTKGSLIDINIDRTLCIEQNRDKPQKQEGRCV